MTATGPETYKAQAVAPGSVEQTAQAWPSGSTSCPLVVAFSEKVSY